MPKIYLSPSTQESNPYITGSGSEEYNMNRLADALEPYLYANGIRFVRNTPDMTAASSIAQANRLGGFDVYLALHSNAAAPESSGSATSSALSSSGSPSSSAMKPIGASLEYKSRTTSSQQRPRPDSSRPPVKL